MADHGLGEDAAAQGLLALQLHEPAAEGEPPLAPSGRSTPMFASFGALSVLVPVLVSWF